MGFFIIESHVLRSTRDFRSSRDVDDLWEDMCQKIVEIVGGGLEGCADLEVFLGVKAQVLMFIQTLEVSLKSRALTHQQVCDGGADSRFFVHTFVGVRVLCRPAQRAAADAV